MALKRVLVVNKTFPVAGLKLFENKVDPIVSAYEDHAPESMPEIRKHLSSGVDALVWNTKHKLTGELLDLAGPRLRVVSTMSSGTDQVHVDELKKRKIPLGNTLRVLDDAVADIAVGVLIAAARRFKEGISDLETGEWKYGVTWTIGQDISGTTVGIVGFGGIGLAIARRLRGFGVARFLYYGRSEKPEAKEFGAQYVDLHRLLKESDHVVLSCPLTADTRHMINEGTLRLMKNNAVLVNIARGGDQLKLVSTVSAGYNHCNIEELRARSIKLSNTPNVLSQSVAELAIALMLGAARRFTENLVQVKSGQWDIGFQKYLGRDIRGSTVGIIGLGGIGQEIVKRLAGFQVARFLYTGHKEKSEGFQKYLGRDIRGSTVGIIGLGGIGQEIVKRLAGFQVARFLYTGHKEKSEGIALGAEFVSLDVLLAESEFVVVAVPLTNETKHIINKETLAKMKKDAILINIGRGDLVDQEALYEALANNQLLAAGLDVTTPEPLPKEHPLLTLPNVFILPHIGSATIRTRRDMAELAANNVVRGLRGEALITPVFIGKQTSV